MEPHRRNAKCVYLPLPRTCLCARLRRADNGNAAGRQAAQVTSVNKLESARVDSWAPVIADQHSVVTRPTHQLASRNMHTLTSTDIDTLILIRTHIHIHMTYPSREAKVAQTMRTRQRANDPIQGAPTPG